MKKAPTLSGSAMFSAVQMISSLLIAVIVDLVMLYVVTVKMLLSSAYNVSYNTVSLMLGNKCSGIRYHKNIRVLSIHLQQLVQSELILELL